MRIARIGAPLAAAAAALCWTALAVHAETLDISASDLLARASGGEAPLIIDVRTPEEFGDGHVPGAINIPHDQIGDRLVELEPHRGRDVVVYCRSGRRAGFAAEALSDAGFQVLHLDGDMKGWRAAGRAEERPAP